MEKLTRYLHFFVESANGALIYKLDSMLHLCLAKIQHKNKHG